MKTLFKKWASVLLTLTLMFFIYSATASAHVVVTPNTSAPGAWETYTMKVPTEKKVPTVKITLKMPDGVQLESYQPVQGWNVKLAKDSSGKVKNITWTATGKGIGVDQFQQFSFVAANPDKQGSAAWDAYQYYKDGSIVEWTGNEKSDTPHSITKITTSATTLNTVTAHDQHQTSSDHSNMNDTSSKNITLTLAIIAVILSILSLFVSFIKRK
ncbi:YcnI family protein [Heyndrickxia ginsengihumi]|uniref:YcnI family copper-binding membrane protein n=1 Tax=Heyndrickxia ginsengihumi TaxID=363870 RepID=UPI003D2036FF